MREAKFSVWVRASPLRMLCWDVQHGLRSGTRSALHSEQSRIVELYKVFANWHSFKVFVVRINNDIKNISIEDGFCGETFICNKCLINCLHLRKQNTKIMDPISMIERPDQTEAAALENFAKNEERTSTCSYILNNPHHRGKKR